MIILITARRYREPQFESDDSDRHTRMSIVVALSRTALHLKMIVWCMSTVSSRLIVTILLG